MLSISYICLVWKHDKNKMLQFQINVLAACKVFGVGTVRERLSHTMSEKRGELLSGGFLMPPAGKHRHKKVDVDQFFFSALSIIGKMMSCSKTEENDNMNMKQYKS